MGDNRVVLACSLLQEDHMHCGDIAARTHGIKASTAGVPEEGWLGRRHGGTSSHNGQLRVNGRSVSEFNVR